MPWVVLIWNPVIRPIPEGGHSTQPGAAPRECDAGVATSRTAATDGLSRPAGIRHGRPAMLGDGSGTTKSKHFTTGVTGVTEDCVAPDFADHLLVHDPLDSIPQSRDVEIDQKSYRTLTQSQIRKKLCVVNRHQLVHGFQFHDHSLGHQQVDSVADVDPGTVVRYRQRQFRLDLQSALHEVVTK